MRKLFLILESLGLIGLTACANVDTQYARYANNDPTSPSSYSRGSYSSADYERRLPPYIETGGKRMVLVDPNVHAWGAYEKDGQLVRAGIVTAGGSTCPPDADPGEKDCRTGIGTFHITSIRGEDCYSKKYPRPNGGGLMPYCMYFNKGQAMHGSPDDIVVEGNISHGCVRMRIPDAEWMTTQFARVGTPVKVLPYTN